MLDLHEISVTAGIDETLLLREVSAEFPTGKLCALLGPSGSGKSTLLKVIAGLREVSQGAVCWNGRDLAAVQDLEPHEIGYVPQFGITHELLSAQESVETALRLRVAGLDSAAYRQRTEQLLAAVGLEEIGDRRVTVLSGGQRRRLALAMELVSAPVLLLCDEVTSGLDAKSEEEIVTLQRQIAHENSCAVLSVTHSLRHLAVHDLVSVLYQGRLVFHGRPDLLGHYFSLEHHDQLFTRLTERPAKVWHEIWQRHRARYDAVEPPADAPSERQGPVETPSFLPQWRTLFARRWKLLLRDPGQVSLQVALLFGFPGLVVIFAWDGLPQIQNVTSGGTALQQLVQSASYSAQSSRVASLVSGLVMFQVILLTLVGSNNAAREIAGEREIFEKEKFAGLRPSAYIASKAAFLLILVLAQSLWMTVFVSTICRFPGELFGQAAMLVLVNGAMTAICLGLSSLMRSGEKASLVCVYLVGFQLPLSGAVLALPEAIGWFTRPFIAAYWGWSGNLQTMRDTRFYDVVLSVSETTLSAAPLCAWVLLCHILAGFLLVYLGARHSRWE